MTDEDSSLFDDILKDDFIDKDRKPKGLEPPGKGPADHPGDDNLTEVIYATTSPSEPNPADNSIPLVFSPLYDRTASSAGPPPPSRNRSPRPTNDDEAQPSTTIPAPQSKQRTRYFVIKSYSAENVTIALRRGIWATQKQNEQLLNDAFLDTPRVILIFSINGSRHFQGYARMTSLIQSKHSGRGKDFSGDVSRWGNTFTLAWERVGSVSFAETDHLRNPMCDNLPLTRARDGQEVTERIGEELCRLIDHRSIPMTADLEFPVTEVERECLLNDPRSQQRGARSSRPEGRRNFEPYPSGRRSGPNSGPIGGGRSDGDRDRRGRADTSSRGRRDERDDRYDENPDRPALRLLPPPEMMMARQMTDIMYGQAPEAMYGQPTQPVMDVDLTQLSYEEYIALKQRQQQQAIMDQQRQMQAAQGQGMRWEDPALLAPQYVPRGDLGASTMFVPTAMPPEGYAQYGAYQPF